MQANERIAKLAHLFVKSTNLGGTEASKEAWEKFRKILQDIGLETLLDRADKLETQAGRLIKAHDVVGETQELEIIADATRTAFMRFDRELNKIAKASESAGERLPF